MDGHAKMDDIELSWMAIQRKVGGFGRKWTLIGHKQMITESGRRMDSKADGLLLFLNCMFSNLGRKRALKGIR